MKPLFDADQLAVVSESELLNLIERWNANRDKPMADVLELVRCFRQTPTNLDNLILFLTNMGLIHVESDSKSVAKKKEAAKMSQEEVGVRQRSCLSTLAC